MEAQHIVDTPLGWMLIQGTKTHITRSLWINEEDAIVGASPLVADWYADLTQQVKEYFDGKRTSFKLPFIFEGSDFQMKIWNELQYIPKGETTTYAHMAEKQGNPNLSQAVGGAVGANPILLFVPCHRVIGSDGSLTGYAGGLDKKQWLLEHEGAFNTPQLRLF